MKSATQLFAMMACAIALMGGNVASAAERLETGKQVLLSTHDVLPEGILRAPDGDLIVFGGSNRASARGWATRLDQTGKVMWEFIEGGPESWSDNSMDQQYFYGALALPDQETLLCGVKIVNAARHVVLITLSKSGAVTSNKVLPVIREGSVLSGLNCYPWRNGIAIFGTVSGNPVGIGWMAEFDVNLNMQWLKFSDDYSSEDVQALGAYLYVLAWHGEDKYIVKIGEEGRTIAKQQLPSGKQHLVQTETNDTVIRAATALPRHELKIDEFDLDLNRLMPTKTLSNVDIKKSLAMPDGSLAIFGSQFRGSATAAVTRVYKDGGYKTFLVEPLHQSPWYIDAVLTGNGSQIAAVRQLGPQSIVEWVSFK